MKKTICLDAELLSLAEICYRMDWTDIHYRQLARCISKHTWLYTEMVVDSTVLHAQPLDKYALQISSKPLKAVSSSALWPVALMQKVCQS